MFRRLLLHPQGGLYLTFKIVVTFFITELKLHYTWDADKSLARPGRKQATATEDFDVHISCL